jgi:hypothetical protein
MWFLCLIKYDCIWSAIELRCKCKYIYFTLLLTFIIKYVYSSITDTYFLFYRDRTTKILLFYRDRTTKIFLLIRKILTSSILDRLAGFIVVKVISQKGELHFS